MKLLYITTRISGAGGMQRVLSVKTDYLVRKGYTISILTTNADADAVIYHFNPQISFYNIKPDRSTLKYFQSYKVLLNNIVDEASPDVIIMCDNGLKGFLLPFLLKKKYPLVYERHGSKFIEDKPSDKTLLNTFKNKLTYRFMDYSAKRFDRFVVLTQAAKKEWNVSDIEAIPNPLWFEEKTASSLENKVAIAVGRHTYEKGYDRMFEAWAKVIAKHHDWVLRIYGDSEKTYDVKALAKKFGVSSNVEFLPSKKDILAAYQQASLCLMTSRTEGFGMVLLEAMACGVPCVAFDCPVGPAEIISNNLDGFLVQDGDMSQFFNKVCELIEDKDLRKKMGEQAKINSQKFDLEPIMHKWIALFNSFKQ